VEPDLNTHSNKDIQETVTITQEPVMAKIVELTQLKSTIDTQEPTITNLNQQSDEATEEATITQESLDEEDELPQLDKVIVTQESMTQALLWKSVMSMNKNLTIRRHKITLSFC
jgi:hypothetical protein